MSLLNKLISENASSDSNKENYDWLDSLFSEKESSYKVEPEHPKSLFWEFEFENSNNSIEPFIIEENEILPELDKDSTENRINSKREKILNERFTSELLTTIREEDFEFGYRSRSEEIISEQLKINALATRNWINDIFIRHFSDEVIVIGILRVIGRFEPNVIFPQGQTIALAALTHKSDEIKELGIRAFEKWCSIESLSILKSIKVDTQWLQDYVDEVVQDLEVQLCLY